MRYAREAADITTNQYRAGIVSYLNIVGAQMAALAFANERAAVDTLNRRLAASIQLLRSLGGGWKATELRLADDGRAVAASSG